MGSKEVLTTLGQSGLERNRCKMVLNISQIFRTGISLADAVYSHIQSHLFFAGEDVLEYADCQQC